MSERRISFLWGSSRKTSELGKGMWRKKPIFRSGLFSLIKPGTKKKWKSWIQTVSKGFASLIIFSATSDFFKEERSFILKFLFNSSSIFLRCSLLLLHRQKREVEESDH